MSWIGSVVVIERMEFVYLKNEVSYFVKYKTIGLFLFGVITYDWREEFSLSIPIDF